MATDYMNLLLLSSIEYDAGVGAADIETARNTVAGAAAPSPDSAAALATWDSAKTAVAPGTTPTSGELLAERAARQDYLDALQAEAAIAQLNLLGE